jgi:hypothetical protein
MSFLIQFENRIAKVENYPTRLYLITLKIFVPGTDTSNLLSMAVIVESRRILEVIRLANTWLIRATSQMAGTDEVLLLSHSLVEYKARHVVVYYYVQCTPSEGLKSMSGRTKILTLRNNTPGGTVA